MGFWLIQGKFRADPYESYIDFSINLRSMTSLSLQQDQPTRVAT